MERSFDVRSKILHLTFRNIVIVAFYFAQTSFPTHRGTAHPLPGTEC